MEPIISPWLIYLINLFDNLNVLLSAVLFLLGGAVATLLIILFFNYMDRNDNCIVACKKCLKKLIIWLCVSSLLFTAIPSKDTMYTMIVLDNVTTDNIQTIGKTGKDVVDYITDQIDKVVNDKEENKK